MEEKTINQMDTSQSLLPECCSLPSSPPLLAGSIGPLQTKGDRMAPAKEALQIP